MVLLHLQNELRPLFTEKVRQNNLFWPFHQHGEHVSRQNALSEDNFEAWGTKVSDQSDLSAAN